MTYKEAAQSALDVQDACNLSGVLFTFADAMQAICEEDRAKNMSTDWKNTNPIVTLFLDKLSQLNKRQCENISLLDDAWDKVKQIARG